MKNLSSNLAAALHANYPEFPDSWLFINLAFAIHVENVLVHRGDADPKQVRHLRLAHPKRVTFVSKLYPEPAVSSVDEKPVACVRVFNEADGFISG